MIARAVVMARKPRKSVKEDCRVTIEVRPWDGPTPWGRYQEPIPEHQRYLAKVTAGPASATRHRAHGATEVETVQAVIRMLQERGFHGVARVERRWWPW